MRLLQLDHRSFGLLLSYLIAIVVFTFLHYWLWSRDNSNYAGAASGFDILYYTAITQVGVGYGDIVPVTKAAKILAIIQSISILFLVLEIFVCFFCPG